MKKNKKKSEKNSKKTDDYKNKDKRIIELSSLSLRNFKAFGDNQKEGSEYQEVALHKFAPLTFIFGKNSSGKSSIIQSINLLAQNYFRGDGLETIDGNGSLTNLGLFDAYVHKHNKKESKILINTKVIKLRKTLSEIMVIN